MIKKRAKNLWHFFSTYEKIWFFSIMILSIIFAFIFPETDDPTYTVIISNDSYAEVEGSFEYLDFTGTDDLFVITGITIGNEEYSISDFTDFDEYTVDPEDPETMRLKLPRPILKSEDFSFEVYPDGDSDVMQVAIQDKENKSLSSINPCLSELGDKGGLNIAENAPKYLVSVTVLMALYLLDTLTNIACELLISKQSKWNFAVSLSVEIIEIAICVVCMYRFATLATTLFFWIPCDIISFFVWNRHPDKEKKEITVVRKLKPWQDVLLVAGIAVWTAGIGYLLTFIEVEGGIFANNVLYKNIACYLDACVSAVGIANGLFILFRFREQWIAWYISAILETIINIMAGQYVLLVLKAGYLTNTTYGYIKWTKYIKSVKNKEPEAIEDKEKAIVG